MRTRTPNVTKDSVVTKMADTLIAWAKSEDISLTDLSRINIGNFNMLLDDLFNDGGETRCERFCDLAWPYSQQFGELESEGFETAQWECIEAAILEVRRRLA